MDDSTASIVEADDVTLRADTAGKSGCRTRKIDGAEVSFVKQEAMVGAAEAVWPDTASRSTRRSRSAAPEPGTWVQLATGVGGLAAGIFGRRYLARASAR
jgi:hypothetical protein